MGSKFCGQCGAPLGVGFLFCGECGAAVKSSSEGKGSSDGGNPSGVRLFAQKKSTVQLVVSEEKDYKQLVAEREGQQRAREKELEKQEKESERQARLANASQTNTFWSASKEKKVSPSTSPPSNTLWSANKEKKASPSTSPPSNTFWSANKEKKKQPQISSSNSSNTFWTTNKKKEKPASSSSASKLKVEKKEQKTSSSNTLWSASKSKNNATTKQEPTGRSAPPPASSTTSPSITSKKPEKTITKNVDLSSDSSPRKPASTQDSNKSGNKETPKDAKKLEEDYVKQQLGQKEIADYRQRRRQQSVFAKTIDPVTCSCTLKVCSFEIRYKSGGDKPDFVVREGKVYRIDVTFDTTQWTIYRRFSQIDNLDGLFRRKVKGYVPSLPVVNPNEYGKNGKFEPAFLEERMKGLTEYFNIVRNSRGVIFASKGAAEGFLKFIAPIQYGDKKPNGFILPFKLNVE